MSTADDDTPGPYEATIEASGDEVRERLEVLAGLWGAAWEPRGTGGSLALPVRAGVRRGLLEGEVTIEDDWAGGARASCVRYTIASSIYRVEYASFFLLVLGAMGGLVAMAAPLAPTLWPLVPVGGFLAFGAWLLIVARLKNRGPEEFLATLATLQLSDDSGS